MKYDKKMLVKKLLFEEFLDWFGNLSREERIVFSEQQTTSGSCSKRARELDYCTLGKAREFFEKNIWPQRVEEKLKNIDRLLKQQEEISEQAHVTIVNKKILLRRKITT